MDMVVFALKKEGKSIAILNAIERKSVSNVKLKVGALYNLNESEKTLIADFYDDDTTGKVIAEITDIAEVASRKKFSHLLLTLIVTSLKNMPKNCDKTVFLIKFLYSVFKAYDIRTSLSHCSGCSAELISDLYVGFNAEKFRFECFSCRDADTYKLTPRTFAEWKMIDDIDFSELGTLKINESSSAYILFILSKAFEIHFGVSNELNKYISKKNIENSRKKVDNKKDIW